VSLADGWTALETIIKRRQGRGFGFDGQLDVGYAAVEYTLRISGNEGLTGMREAAVNAKMIELGEIDIAALMSGPPGADGAQAVKELAPRDPYDPEFDDDAIYAASDDERLDPIFPGHPLTVVRDVLTRARKTWVADAGRPGEENLVPPAGPGGPRRLLSDAVVRELYWITGRNDLLEAELTAAIASAEAAGREMDAASARLLTMLGVVQHNSQNALKARNTLRKAERTLTTVLGDHRDTGCALVLLGRSEITLSRYLDAERSLRRAVAILERQPTADLHLRNALALLASSLAQQNRAGEAAQVLERLQRLPEPPHRDGPAMLHVLAGGLASGFTTTTKVVP
jgi:hypothetical protein